MVCWRQVKAGRKPKPAKDPGIPSQWPFKAELVKELEWEKQNILAKERQKKAERRAARVRCPAAGCPTLSVPGRQPSAQLPASSACLSRHSLPTLH